MAEITTILQIVAWGASLSLSLYDFGAAVSSATKDATRLARGVNLFSLALRQVGASLKEDGEVASGEALETVQEIIAQCKTVFTEIEALVPVSQPKDARGSKKPLSLAQKWKWSVHSTSKVQYLVAHLESLKMTLSVMLQTFYTTQVIATSRQLHTFARLDPVQTERLQLESLIMEQQMCFVRAHEAYDEYKRTTGGQSHDIPQSPAVWAIADGSAAEATPASLVRYQEPSLAELDVTESEAEKVAAIRRKAGSFVESLLDRWTRIHEIEKRLRRVELTQQEQKQRERRYRQQPTVESGDSSDGETARIRKVGDYMAHNPVHPHINLKRPSVDTTLPIPIPVSPKTIRRSSGLSGTSPTSHQPWSPGTSPNYIPNSPQSVSPAFSPSSPLRFSVSRPDHLQTAERRSSESGLNIPWRLGLLADYWDFIDNMVIKTNSQLPPTSVGTDRKAYTEMAASWASQEAIESMGYNYLPFQRTSTSDTKTAMEPYFRIHAPLSFAEVEKLVDLTVTMYRRQQKPQRAAGRPRMSPLDRSQTAPSNPFPFAGINNTPIYLDPAHARSRNRLREHTVGSSSSTTYSSDGETDHDRERSPQHSRHGSTASRRSRAERERRLTSEEDRERERERERSRHSTHSTHSHRERDRDRHSHDYKREKDKNHGTSYTLGKLAQGAGFAAILDGLAGSLGGL